MTIQTDFSVAVNGDIRWTGAGTTAYTVLEFHAMLREFADDESGSGDDLLDITSETPSDRSTDNIITLINGYNITATEAEHLYDGSIRQGSGLTEEIFAGLVVVGSVVAGTEIEIIQDNALLTNYWTTGLNADAANNIIMRLCIQVKANGAQIDGQRLRVQAREFNDTYGEFSVTMGLGNNTAALFTADDLNNNNTAANVATWTTITNTEGYQLVEIDGTAPAEPYYSQWDSGASGETGRADTLNDIRERTKWISRRGTAETLYGGLSGALFRGITHDVTYDTAVGTFTEGNYVAWGTEVAYDTELASGLTVGKYYEFDSGAAYGKLIGLDDNGTAGFALFAMESGGAALADGNNFTAADGTANNGATINVTINDDGAAGGFGVILADEGTSQLYIQLLAGAAPSDNLKMWETTTAGVYDNATGAAATPNVTITSRTVAPEWLAVSTGSNLIGVYGNSVTPAETSSSDQFFDLDNVNRVPPNNVTFTVAGLISGEDRVLVAPELAGAIDLAQDTLNGTLSGAAVTTVTVNSAEPDNNPSSGTLRIERDNGIYTRHPFSVRSGFDYTITSHDFSTVNATTGNNVFVSYIDLLATGASESVTVVFDSADTWFVRVRDGGSAGDLTAIKTFETTSPLGTGGGSATAIRTSDA
jgi:hypothetical protein